MLVEDEQPKDASGWYSKKRAHTIAFKLFLKATCLRSSTLLMDVNDTYLIGDFIKKVKEISVKTPSSY